MAYLRRLLLEVLFRVNDVLGNSLEISKFNVTQILRSNSTILATSRFSMIISIERITYLLDTAILQLLEQTTEYDLSKSSQFSLFNLLAPYFITNIFKPTSKKNLAKPAIPTECLVKFMIISVNLNKKSATDQKFLSKAREAVGVLLW